MVFMGMRVLDEGSTCGVLDEGLADALNIAGDAQREGAFSRADAIVRDVLATYSMVDLPIEVLCPLTTRGLSGLLYKIGLDKGSTGNPMSGPSTFKALADVLRWTSLDLATVPGLGAIAAAVIGGRLQSLGLNLSNETDYDWVKPISRRTIGKRRDCVRALPLFKILRVWTNEIDTVIATDVNDVRAILRYLPSPHATPGFQATDWRVLPAKDALSISIMKDDDHTTTTKTCAEWVTYNGRGPLCTLGED